MYATTTTTKSKYDGGYGLRIGIIGLAILGYAGYASGATVIFKAPNVSCSFTLSYSQLEQENPLEGKIILDNHLVLEWRDADFCEDGTLSYDDWVVNRPSTSCNAPADGIFGYQNEIWLLQGGDVADTTTTVPSSTVSIHLHGDSNDGIAQIRVDGVIVAELDMFTAGTPEDAFVVVSGLPSTVHTIDVEHMGLGDIAIMGAAALELVCNNIIDDTDGTMEDVVAIDYTDDNMSKTIQLTNQPISTNSARLWIFGQPYNYPNNTFQPRLDYSLQVNGSSQEILFDVGSKFGYRDDIFQWVAFDIPISWLVVGDNQFYLTEKRNTGAHWETNNLRVGLDTTTDVDRSRWYGNGDFCNTATACPGELMMLLELCNTCSSIESPQPSDDPVDIGFGTKNRYISFKGGNPGRQTAVRVRFEMLPPPHDIATGMVMWVAQPRLICENSGQGGVEDPAQCGSAGINTGLTTWMSKLQCQPFFTDWSNYDIVHAYDEYVVPSSKYHLQEVDIACEIEDENNFSSTYEIDSSRWGDLVLTCSTCPCGPPDGTVNIVTDVTAVLDKFKNDPCAPKKARCDLEPSVPDQKINFTDVTAALDAFKGKPYPFSPSAPPCGGATSMASVSSVDSNNFDGRQSRTGTLEGLEADEGLENDSSVTIALQSTAAITVVPREYSKQTDDVYIVDVFADQVTDLRGYQVTLDVTGGNSGTMELEDLWIETEAQDYVFAEEYALSAVDIFGGRAGAVLIAGGIDIAQAAYLGTFSFRASDDATGKFDVIVRLNETDLRDSNNQSISIRSAASASIQVGLETRKMSRR